MSRVPKEGLALLLKGKMDDEGGDDAPVSSRRPMGEDEPDEKADDADEKEQLDRVWSAVKGDDREEFDDALVSLIHVCMKEY